MEWETSERDAWVVDAERWICQLQDVRQCKIDLDLHGNITGVHVVTGTEREPRHIVRDVEGLMKARLSIDVFYKKIGVVQVVDEKAVDPDQPAPAGSGPGKAEPVASAASVAGSDPRPGAGGEPTAAVILEEIVPPRILCTGVGVHATEELIRAEVELQAGILEARGVAEGVNRAGGDLPLVGEAALAALTELLAEPVLLSLGEVRQTDLAGQSVIMAAVELVEGRRSERLFGTCPTAPNRPQAVVYALLDALNRRLSLLAFQDPEVED